MKKKHNKIGSLFLSLVLLSFTTGCWNIKNVERTFFINSLGIDYVNNKFVLYSQFIDFTGVAKPESGGQRGTKPVWIEKGTGKTFDDAAFALYPAAQQKMSWSHISAIVFTERALKSEEVIKQVFDLVNRYHEIRQTTWIFGTKKAIEDVFTSKPPIGYSPIYSILNDPKDIYGQYSIVKPIMLREMIKQINEPGQTVFLPYLMVAKRKWNKEHNEYTTIETDGMGAVDKRGLLAHFPKRTLLGLRWVEKGIKRTPLRLYKNKKPSVLLVVRNPKAKITYEVKGTDVYVDVEISIRGSTTEIEQRVTEQEIVDEAKKMVKKQVRDAFDTGVKRNVDLFQISYMLYRKDYKTWERLNRNGYIALTKDSLRNIKVEVEISSSGKSKLTTHEFNDFKVEKEK